MFLRVAIAMMATSLIAAATIAACTSEVSVTVEVPVTVEVVREVDVPVEVPVTVEVVREVDVPFEVVSEVVVTREIELPVEVVREIVVTREIEVPIEVKHEIVVTKEVGVPVELPVPVTRVVEVPVEVTRIVEVPVEVTRIVQATTEPSATAETESEPPETASALDNSVYDSPPAWMVWRSLKETPASSKTDESPDAEQIMVSWYEWVPTVYIEENIRFQQQHSPRKLDENVVIQYENQLEIDEVFARSPVRRFTCREPEVSGYDRTLTFYEGSCSFYSIDRRADYHGGAGNYTEKLSVIDERDVVGTDETPAYPPSWTGYVGMYYRDVDGIYTDDSGLIPVINPSPQYFPKPGGIATDIRGVAEYPNFNWRFSNDLEWGGGSVFLLGYGDVWNSATEEDDSTLFLGSFSNNKSHSVQLDERITDPQGLAITQHRTFSIFKNQHPTTFYVLDASEPRLYHHTGWRGNSEWEYVDLPTDRTYRGVTAIRAGDDFDDDVIYLLTDTHIEERTRPDFALTRIVLPPSGSQNLKDLDSRPYQVYELDLDKDNWQANFEEHSSPVLSISEGVLVLYLMAENSEGVTKLYRATLPFMESTKEIEP